MGRMMNTIGNLQPKAKAQAQGDESVALVVRRSGNKKGHHHLHQQSSLSGSFGNGIKQLLGGVGIIINMEKRFKQRFSVRVSEGEQLLKAWQCSLSTTAGPIAGLLFVSTHKLAFCSHSSIDVNLSSSTTHHLLTFHYKVVIPLRKIERANQRESMKNKSKKYLQLNTTYEFEFWFMGFRNYNKMFHCLKHAISQALELISHKIYNCSGLANLHI